MMKMVKSRRQAAQNSISSRTGLMLMTLVLLLAFALGANGLNADVIWIDELYSVSNMGVFNPPYSPAQIIDSLMTHSPDHVPLFYLLGAGWAQLAGWSQFSMRLISLFSGVLMIAWLYRFATDAVNRRTGMAAAFLIGTTAFVVFHFHEIRMYTLFMQLGIMHSWLYWRLAHGYQITRLTWLLFILTAAMLLYTHNFAMVLFAGLGIYHLIFLAGSKRWLNIMLGWGFGALLFLPYLPNIVSGLSRVSGDSLNPRSAPYMELVEVLAQLLSNSLEILWLPLMLLLGYALWQRRTRAILGLLTIALTMIAVLLLANWQSQLISLDRMRYFLVAWPPGGHLAWLGTDIAPWLVCNNDIDWFAMVYSWLSIWSIY